ncbi:MAG: T9SS type A sorting domain-containing protein [Prevotellaceae bacterium]|jgi:hypothetical protein|nr:T9SS type A sorting domain-containing protein [Prevotellaceae bacterium]
MHKSINKIILVALFVCGMAAISNAAIWYVQASGSGGSGSSPIAPSSNLQQIIENAAPGDEVWVMGGTYSPQNSPHYFTMRLGVKILGGYKPADYSWTVRNPQQYPTYLQPVGDNPIFVNTTNYGQIDATAILDGFILQNGSATNGGAMHNTGVSPTIRNCKFVNCSASNYGGAMYNTICYSLFENCTFEICSATKYGGAVYNTRSEPVFKNCTFTYCNANSGGAIYNAANQVAVIDNCVFRDCFSIRGGAICDISSTLFINSSYFDNNRSFYGGAIYGGLSQWEFKNNVFINNWAVGSAYQPPMLYLECEGGSLYYIQSNVTIEDNLFENNLATFRGGAIVSIMSEDFCVNCTFRGNISRIGSGVYTQFSHTQILRSIFQANGTLSLVPIPNVGPNGTTLSFASEEGGAIFTDGEKGGHAILENLLITDNMAKYGAGIYNNRMELGMAHLTVTLNMGAAGAGFYYNDDLSNTQYPTGNIKCLNSIIYSNMGATGNILTDNISNTGYVNIPMFVDFNHCDIEGSSNWMPNILGNFGNPVIDIFPDFINFAPYNPNNNSYGDFHLNNNYADPCIGGGMNGIGVVDDLDNYNVRPYGPRPDMGCYENMNVWKNMVVHNENESITTSEPAAKLQLYPNPVTSGHPLMLEIAGYDKTVEVIVYNMMGMKVLQTNAANGINSVALPATAGTYFVRITADTGEVIGREKITVQ